MLGIEIDASPQRREIQQPETEPGRAPDSGKGQHRGEGVGGHSRCIQFHASQQPSASPATSSPRLQKIPASNIRSSQRPTKTPIKGRGHDRPAQHADHRQVAADRPLALAPPAFPPNPAQLDRSIQTFRVVGPVVRRRRTRPHGAAARSPCAGGPAGPSRAGARSDRRKRTILRIAARCRRCACERASCSSRELRRNRASTSDCEPAQIVTRHRFRGCDRDRIAAAHREHAAAQRDVMLGTGGVAPARHRYRQRGQKIGVAGQDAERAGFVLGAQMPHIVGLDDKRERRRDGQLHGAPAVRASAAASAPCGAPRRDRRPCKATPRPTRRPRRRGSRGTRRESLPARPCGRAFR